LFVNIKYLIAFETVFLLDFKFLVNTIY